MAERRLGKGLESLIGARVGEESIVVAIPVDKLQPNPNQPREAISDLKGLISSIAEEGLLQPIVVRPVGEEDYEIVMGERRWRAAQEVGISHIPAIVRRVSDEKMMQLALIENIHRKDLNPIELARAYNALCREHSLTQSELAKRLGVSRSTLTNTIRLLELPAAVKRLIEDRSLSLGHAKLLLSVADPKRMLSLGFRTVQEGLSVRRLEKLISGRKLKTRRKKKSEKKAAHIRALEDRLMQQFNTRVRIYEQAGRGRFVIEFDSPKDFKHVLDIFAAAARRNVPPPPLRMPHSPESNP